MAAIRARLAEGQSPTRIAREMGFSRVSVYKVTVGVRRERRQRPPAPETIVTVDQRPTMH